MVKKRLSMCAGQGFRIAPIVRPYRREDRVRLPGIPVWGENGLMYPYKAYVPEHVHGGEG